MPRQALNDTLRLLHDQLSEIEDLNADQVAQLRSAVTEIESTLDHAEVNTASLASRLREATLQFEESHPVLTGTIGRMADMLAQMGI